ncbi:MAG TPA: methyltransferase domain-containing protein [Pirellulaceae bacterium]|nr:methyltransferase domain-containing protein [Pirellulaceae bacterium]
MAQSADDDYGVPIPGRVLPAEQWARTAIKRLPPPGFQDWKEIFVREAPVVLDLGCGNGRFVISSALARPQFDHIGIEILPVVIRYATRRANQRGLSNVRLAVIGAYEFLAQYVAPASVTEIHLYHPQPYRDSEKKHRRLLTPEFLALVHRSLVANGLVVLQTDNKAYWQYLRRIAPLFFNFEDLSGLWSDSPRGRTRREIYARRRGMAIYRGQGSPRPELTAEAIQQICHAAPRPNFSA